MQFHTVYNSYECRGRDYIGKHSTDNPYDDYKGSFKDDTFCPDEKIILIYAKTPEGAVWLEEQFQRVFQVVEDNQFANRSYQTSDKFVCGFSGEDNPAKRLEVRQKISNSKKGKPNPDLRQRNFVSNPMKNPVARDKLREARNNNDEWNSNVAKSRQTAESREKSRIATTEQWSVPGVKEEFSERRKGNGNPCFGQKWWVNPQNEACYQPESPGPEWQNGRVYRAP